MSPFPGSMQSLARTTLPCPGKYCWGALLRPGEIFVSSRADLLLPKDVDFTIAFGLLAIKEPKTRRTGARHQAAKLDAPDLLEVVNFCFGNLPPSAKLWPWSGQTFRTRFRDVLTALKLPTQKLGDMKALDPGSLRFGRCHVAPPNNRRW